MLAFRLLEEGATESGGLSWLALVVLAVFFVMVAIGWYVSNNGLLKKEEELVHGGHDDHGSHGHDDHGHAGPDVLTSLEGVGPKVAKLLNGMGVTTFAQLAHVDKAKLRKVLDGAGYKYMEPDGWIEQAALAAKGDTEGLKKLQSQLKGGRKK